MGKRQFLLAFANSGLVAIASVFFQVITSTLAGYALARLKFRGKNFIILLIISTLIIPFQVLVIPIFFNLKMGTFNQYLLGVNIAFCRQWFRYFF